MRIACVQADVVFGDPRANADRVLRELESLSARGVDLAVFPEAFLTGYCVECVDDAEKIAMQVEANERREVVSAPVEIETIRDACTRLDLHAVVGFAGRSSEGLYNGALLFAPGEPPRRYVKTHLPMLGFDRFVVPGDGLPVFQTRLGRIGILICFDLRPPEPARVMALAGADLVVLPTNWPIGAEISAEFISIARAAENRIFVATCNRTGEEHGFRFFGRSKIVHPSGKVLAAADEAEETLIADLDLDEARHKRTVNIPGRYETTVFESRRVELYRTLCRSPE
jgi:5-aminopentanamidase